MEDGLVGLLIKVLAFENCTIKLIVSPITMSTPPEEFSADMLFRVDVFGLRVLAGIVVYP